MPAAPSVAPTTAALATAPIAYAAKSCQSRALPPLRGGLVAVTSETPQGLVSCAMPATTASTGAETRIRAVMVMRSQEGPANEAHEQGTGLHSTHWKSLFPAMQVHCQQSLLPQSLQDVKLVHQPQLEG